MKYTLQLKNIPTGYALHSAKKGDKLKVICKEFVSSEDGDLLISRLEVLNMLISNQPVKPSQIDNLLAIVHPNKTVEVLINEVKVIMKIKPKKSIKKGEYIFVDDIADIKSISFANISIPENCGVLYLFSIGWRKGFYYDYSVLNQKNKIRNYNLNEILGNYYAYLYFQDLYKITTKEWEKLFKNDFFPFIALNNSTIKKLLNYIRNNWSLEELIEDIFNEVITSVNNSMEFYKGDKFFSKQFPFIERSFQYLQNSDYIGSISTLYPRIEGILRELRFYLNPDCVSAKQKEQSDTINQLLNNQVSILLPLRFSEYLTRVYFKNFSPRIPEGLSRNTIGHGVAKENLYDKKGALLGFLILEQIKYFVPNDDN